MGLVFQGGKARLDPVRIIFQIWMEDHYLRRTQAPVFTAHNGWWPDVNATTQKVPTTSPNCHDLAYEVMVPFDEDNADITTSPMERVRLTKMDALATVCLASNELTREGLRLLLLCVRHTISLTRPRCVCALKINFADAMHVSSASFLGLTWGCLPVVDRIPFRCGNGGIQVD